MHVSPDSGPPTRFLLPLTPIQVVSRNLPSPHLFLPSLPGSPQSLHSPSPSLLNLLSSTSELLADALLAAKPTSPTLTSLRHRNKGLVPSRHLTEICRMNEQTSEQTQGLTSNAFHIHLPQSDHDPLNVQASQLPSNCSFLLSSLWSHNTFPFASPVFLLSSPDYGLAVVSSAPYYGDIGILVSGPSFHIICVTLMLCDMTS